MTDAELDVLFRMEDAALAAARAEFRARTIPAPLPAPTSRRIGPLDLHYIRSFRLPRSKSNGQAFDFGGSHLAFNPARGTLFVMNHGSNDPVHVPVAVAEITIPTEDRAFAEYVQGFVDPTEGKGTELFGDLAAPAGLLVVDEQQLLGTMSIYYDAMNTQRVSHYTRPLDLSARGQVSDLMSVWDPTRTGFVAGYLAHVPRDWVAALGGLFVTGQFGTPIVSRTSQGPAAFAFGGNGMTAPKVLAATPLVYYPGEHPTLGSWAASAPNAIYGSTTSCGGLVLIDDSALFFGRHGFGKQTYGIGTSDATLDGKDDGEGGQYCFDPANSSKGPHAYPYCYQVWAYDLHHFAAVAAGTKEPWDVFPYAVWPLTFPTLEHEFRGIGGVAWNAASRALYVSQLSADQDGYAYRAWIHAFQVPQAA
jgi:hypothetical protein